jgi:hypothetical protein
MSESTSRTSKDGKSTRGEARKAGAFDIRTFIALLIGIYGVVLVIMGAIGPSDAQRAKASGVNINLWAGIGMVVVAALFQAWAMWRPVILKEEPADSGTDARIVE